MNPLSRTHRDPRAFRSGAGPVVRTRAGSMALAVLVAGAPAAAAQSAADAGLVATVDSIFSSLRDPTAPGCAAGGYRDGRLVVGRGYGAADLERKVPISTGTVFNVGSVSKQFTALAVLLLVEDQRLSLDTDIRELLPELSGIPGGITVRHLLHHTSGLRDPFGALLVSGWRSHDVITVGDLIAVTARQRTVNFPPGADFQYNTGAFALLAEIVARKSGMPFGEFSRRRIFEPLGMTGTVILEHHQQVIPARAIGYSRVDGGRWGIDVAQSDFGGATGVHTSVEDLARWIANLESPRVGRPETIRLLRTAARLTDGTTGAYGMGLFPSRFRGRPVESHGGADGGYRSFFVHLPEERIGAAVLCNSPGPNPDALAHRILGALLEATGSQATAPAAAITGSGNGGAVPGRYWNAELERLVTIQTKEGGIEALGVGRPVPFAGTSPGTFVTTAENPDTIVFTPEGLRWQRPGFRAASFAPVPPSTPARPVAEYAGIYRSAEIAATWTVEPGDTALIIRAERMDQFPVQRAFGDVFISPFVVVRFTRDRRGGVDGMLVTDQGGRLRRIPFLKQGGLPQG